MKKEILFTMASPFRDTFRIWGYRFGSGKKTLAIVGSMRGDEVQQQYVCAQLVQRLSALEADGKLNPDCEILIIPSVNPFSMNIGKRFWAMDSTDINRMFPGYNLGETTQRIAAAVFEHIQGYEYGVQMSSFYLPGEFIPHVRITKTGYEDTDTAKLFGLPYISIHTPLPFDTTFLNYNWQIWGTKAYSIHAGQNSEIGTASSSSSIASLLRFMLRLGIISHLPIRQPDYNSMIITEEDLVTISATQGGIFHRLRSAGEEVKAGDVLARIIHPYEGTVLEELKSPVDGVVFFAYNDPTVLEHTPVYKIHEI